MVSLRKKRWKRKGVRSQPVQLRIVLVEYWHLSQTDHCHWAHYSGLGCGSYHAALAHLYQVGHKTKPRVVWRLHNGIECPLFPFCGPAPWI
jgi:hypothetical protein